MSITPLPALCASSVPAATTRAVLSAASPAMLPWAVMVTARATMALPLTKMPPPGVASVIVPALPPVPKAEMPARSKLMSPRTAPVTKEMAPLLAWMSVVMLPVMDPVPSTPAPAVADTRLTARRMPFSAALRPADRVSVSAARASPCRDRSAPTVTDKSAPAVWTACAVVAVRP